MGIGALSIGLALLFYFIGTATSSAKLLGYSTTLSYVGWSLSLIPQAFEAYPRCAFVLAGIAVLYKVRRHLWMVTHLPRALYTNPIVHGPRSKMCGKLCCGCVIAVAVIAVLSQVQSASPVYELALKGRGS